jgi:hypothetical protein
MTQNSALKGRFQQKRKSKDLTLGYYGSFKKRIADIACHSLIRPVRFQRGGHRSISEDASLTLWYPYESLQSGSAT